jgi:hypothetical protein
MFGEDYGDFEDDEEEEEEEGDGMIIFLPMCSFLETFPSVNFFMSLL